MNKIVLTGRLVHTPELKTTPSGVSVCRFSIAVDRKFKVNGEKVTDFFDCVAWRSTGEFVAKYFDKGRKIGVMGEMQSRQYEAKDGTNRRVWEVSVDDVEFCDTKPGGTEQTGAAAPQGSQTGFVPVDDDGDLPF